MHIFTLAENLSDACFLIYPQYIIGWLGMRI